MHAVGRAASADSSPGLSAPDHSALGLFGGGRFRSRFTDAVWQGPTWSLAILLAVVRLRDGSQTAPQTAPFVAGVGVVMGVTLAAVLVRWERWPARLQLVLPAGDLVGAALMVLADPDGAAGVVLLCSLPVVWLAFEFGRAGMLSGIAVTVLAALGAVSQQPEATRFRGPVNVLLTAAFVVGLAVVARLMSGILHRVGETLRGQNAVIDDERALAQERLTLMTGVMASVDLGVIVLRPGAAPLLNAQAEAMARRMGLSPTELAQGGTQVFSDAALTPVPPTQQVVNRALTGEEFVGVRNWIGPPGDQRVVVASSRRLRGQRDEPTTSVVALWDATELVDAIGVRDEFLTTVSHELRTPLTAIAASAETLVHHVDDRLGTDPPRLLAAILRNTDLLTARIDDLLVSTRSTDPALRTARVDVTAMVDAALVKHGSHLTSSGVSLEHRTGPTVIAEVDPTLFERLVDNLVSNAVKYTDPGGLITVTVRRQGSRVVLRVADSGIGMTFDEQRQAFDRFYRAPRARDGAIQGLGIGLSLVQAIVERHHGSIDLSSAPGAGTIVTVSIPLAVARSTGGRLDPGGNPTGGTTTDLTPETIPADRPTG